MESAAIPAQIKSALRQQMRASDPFVLKKQINSIQTRLLALVRSKNMNIQYPGSSYPQATERMSRQLFG